LFWRGWDPAARAALDGAEIAHPMMMGDPQARAELIEFTRATRVLNPRLAPIGSTDFHYRQPMGLCRTFLFAREYSEAGVLEAIRAGRTVAFDPDGRAYGDPGLVAAATRVKASNDPPDRWRRLLDALSGCLALIGLAGWMIQD
jgi:hypothetical protein